MLCDSEGHWSIHVHFVPISDTRLPVMERYGPHKWPPLPKLRVNVPPPPAPRNLESLADVCQEIFQLASDIALGQKKVVLCCSLGGQGISLDLCGGRYSLYNLRCLCSFYRDVVSGWRIPRRVFYFVLYYFPVVCDLHVCQGSYWVSLMWLGYES